MRAVVAEGATGRTSTDLSWLPARYGWRGALQHHVERWRDTVTAVLARARPPIALAAAVTLARQTRFLLITAGEVADETFAADALRARGPHPRPDVEHPRRLTRGGARARPGLVAPARDHLPRRHAARRCGRTRRLIGVSTTRNVAPNGVDGVVVAPAVPARD